MTCNCYHTRTVGVRAARLIGHPYLVFGWIPENVRPCGRDKHIVDALNALRKPRTTQNWLSISRASFTAIFAKRSSEPGDGANRAVHQLHVSKVYRLAKHLDEKMARLHVDKLGLTLREALRSQDILRALSLTPRRR